MGRVVLAVAFLGLGCSHSNNYARVPIVREGEVVAVAEAESTETTLFRKKVYRQSLDLVDPTTGVEVASSVDGCDQGMSGNLGSAVLGVVALLSNPVVTGLAALGVVGQEYAQSRSPVSHAESRCQAFPSQPLPSIPAPLRVEDGR